MVRISALDPKDVAAGLSAEQEEALVNLTWRNDLGKPVEQWRGPLMVWRGYDVPPSLTVLGRSVLSEIMAQRNQLR